MKRLTVRVKNTDANVARCKRISLSKRIMRRLFGTTQDIVVLIPGAKIQDLDIQNVENADE